MARRGFNPGINVPNPGEAHPNVILALQQIILKLGRLSNPQFKGIALTDLADAGAGFMKNDADGTLTGGNTISVSDLPSHASTHQSGGSDEVGHDSLAGFVANEHVDHTAVTVTGGGILSGGGDISASRVISLAHSDVDHDQTTNFVSDEHVDHTAVTVTGGGILSGGGDISASRSITLAHSDVDHGSISGLSDDDHAQYALLSGRSGGQVLSGGTNASDTLTLRGSSNATPGVTYIEPDDAGRVCIGTSDMSSLVSPYSCAFVGPASDATNMPGWSIYNVGSNYPTIGCRGYSHSNAQIEWNLYYGGDPVATRGSHTGECWRIFATDSLFRISANYCASAGSTVEATRALFSHTSGITQINEYGLDIDFKVRSDNDEYALFVQGSDGNVGFGVATPQEDVHAADTVRADTAFNLNGTDGLSGTLTIDDGANWRVTLTFSGGILTGQTTGASSSATASWS